MRSLTQRLTAFNLRFGRPVRSSPNADLPSSEVEQALRKLDEELEEMRVAIRNKDLVGIADGLGDVIYVASGISIQFGIDIDAVLDLIHISNMTKSAEPGGPAKGPSYTDPQIEMALSKMHIRVPPFAR